MGAPRALRHDTFQLDPVLDFMRLLWSVEHGLQRMSKKMENDLGITGPQAPRLASRRAVSRCVARRISRHRPVASKHDPGILDRLVGRGLVERKRVRVTAGVPVSGSSHPPYRIPAPGPELLNGWSHWRSTKPVRPTFAPLRTVLTAVAQRFNDL